MRISKLLLWSSMLLLFSCKGSQLAKKFDKHTLDEYVVVVSMDGFRWDYPDKYETPHLDKLGEQGVKASQLIPSFPTKTFPNHYTLATGLFPDHHGIINNSFYAEDLGGIYRIRDSIMVTDPDAYFGEPIWVTAENQGVKSASFFWVGSEAPIKGVSPSYWKKYNESIPYEQRVDQVIGWLELPVEKRPGLVMLYFDEPDHTGHSMGPEHKATGEVVAYLDSVLGYLRSEIEALPYGDRVNLIVLSDHGMGSLSPDRYVNLSQHMEESWTESVIGGNPVYLIAPSEGFEDSITLSLDKLEGVSAWKKEDIPEHLHYGSSPRFPGIVAVADSGWSIGMKEESSGYNGGAHGYDQTFSEMHAIFYADGPAFKDGLMVPAFSNVEVYGIIAHILGLDPASTDGDLSQVMHLFRSEK